MAVNERSASQGQTTVFQPEDLLRQAQIQDAALSPDGSNVVYSRRVVADNAYRTHLWIVPWSGGDPRQLTHAAVNDTRPVFSPDGRLLAFISDRGGRAQPWILPLDGGEPRLAADIAGDASAVHWSPDGQQLLIMAPSGVERLVVGDPQDPIARVVDDFAWRLDGAGFRNQLTSAWVVPISGSYQWRRAAPRDQRGLGDSRCTVVAGWRASCGRGRHRTRRRDAPAERAGSCLAT